MMPRVDFYLLKDNAGGDRLGLTCRLVERIRGQASPPRVHIHCPDPALAETLDQLLWTYREDSFLPHGRVGQTDATLTPILIGDDGNPGGSDQVLINLAEQPPANYQDFERICEPLDQDPAVRNAGRRRYAHYRDQGCELHHHEVG